MENLLKFSGPISLLLNLLIGSYIFFKLIYPNLKCKNNSKTFDIKIEDMEMEQLNPQNDTPITPETNDLTETKGMDDKIIVTVIPSIQQDTIRPHINDEKNALTANAAQGEMLV